MVIYINFKSEYEKRELKKKMEIELIKYKMNLFRINKISC